MDTPWLCKEDCSVNKAQFQRQFTYNSIQKHYQSKYAPWTYTSSESAYRKINSIYRNLSWYAVRVEPAVAPQSVRPQARAGVEDKAASQSRIQGCRSHAQTVVAGRVEPWKLKNDSPSTTDPSQKRKKATAGARSSGSALTHVDRRLDRKDGPIPDFEKFAKAQDDFWKECKGCYLFGQ